jgi:hypothetical protein
MIKYHLGISEILLDFLGIFKSFGFLKKIRNISGIFCFFELEKKLKKRKPSKSASVKTASNEIQKTQFGQCQHTRNHNSQFQNSQCQNAQFCCIAFS